MSRRAATRLSAALFLAGFALFGEGAWIAVKAELAQLLLHRAWTKTLAGNPRAKPWPWADTWPVARLSLPKRGGDFIVLEGTSGRSLAFAPGHWSGTARPGESGRCVISAHRDTHFASLARVAAGDSVFVETADGKRVVYEVEETRVVDRRDRRVLLDDRPRGPTLVLVTCYPFGGILPGGPLRYVVTARMVEERAERYGV